MFARIRKNFGTVLLSESDPQLLTQLLDVERAARRGARSATSERQLVADAVDATRSVWIRRVLDSDEPKDASAWAFRVAVNHVKRVGSGKLAHADVGSEFAAVSDSVPRSREKLHSRFGQLRKRLTSVQVRVVEKLAEPGMSKHRAARELGMDRSNLRRAFQRALTTLGQAEGGR